MSNPLEFALAAPAAASSVKRLLSDTGLPTEDVGAHLDHFIVAMDRGTLAGVIGLEPLGSVGLLRSLAVAGTHRNQGLAKALYGRLLAYARIRGIRRLYVLTLTAGGFFVKQGFARIRRASAPEEIRATREFGTLCPDTAELLAKDIWNEAHHYPRDMLQLRPDVPGARMWAVALEKAMLTYFEVEPHTRFERHSHEAEQITMVLKGELFFEMDDRVIQVEEGDAIAIPSNLPHAVYATRHRACAIDAWSPIPGKYQDKDA